MPKFRLSVGLIYGEGTAAFNRQFSEHFEETSEHGIFHGITNWQENKPLNIKDNNGLFAIEWE